MNAQCENDRIRSFNKIHGYNVRKIHIQGGGGEGRGGERTYLDYITLPCKASLVITNVWTRYLCLCIVIGRRRCHAERVAYEVHPLMGISTSGTILSSLSPYTSGSIKSPIPRWASRWLRLQHRPRAHQSEPASAGESISVSPLALLSRTHDP